MALLSGYRTKAVSLINRLGRSVLIRTYTQGGTSYDPTLTPTDTPAVAAVFNFKSEEIDGTVIKRDDKLFLIGAISTVTQKDKIVDDSKEYTIISLEKIGPGDEEFYYRVQGRL